MSVLASRAAQAQSWCAVSQFYVSLMAWSHGLSSPGLEHLRRTPASPLAAKHYLRGAQLACPNPLPQCESSNRNYMARPGDLFH